MSSARDHLLIALWVDEREGEGRDADLHGHEALSGETRAALLAEAERAGEAVSRDGEWRLTEDGERVARALVRRHRLAERLFSDVLELPESEFELSACRFEHTLSQRAADRICTLLAHPSSCPHGRPIPPGDCCRARRRTLEPIVERLPDLSPGDEARVVFVTPSAGSRLEKLGALGISPGSTVKLIQRLPSFVIAAGETEIAIEEAVGQEIFVARVAGSARDESPRRGAGAALRFGLGLLRLTLRAVAVLVVSAVIASSGFATPAEAQVLLTEEQAVERILGAYDALDRIEVAIDDAQRAQIAEESGCAVPEEQITFLTARREGAGAGWVFVGDVLGLYEPITYAVGISDAGDVKDVEILVYRESRGGEVRRRRFLNQYRGKNDGSPLRLNHDILNITGATVSSRAVTAGVKKALVAFRVLGVAGTPIEASRAQ